MVRIAKPTDPKKLAKLKELINSDKYLNHAVTGIAQTLTHGLLQWNGVELENESRKR